MARAKSKNVSVTEERNTEYPAYDPTAKEREVISSVFEKFRISASDRNRNFEYFDNTNLIEYIEDSVRRFTTNIDEREDMEDWQARVHDPFTRNKVLAVLGKVVQVLPIAEFNARGDEDYRRASILNDLYQYSEDVDDYEELMIHLLLEAIVKGTAIGYEGMDHIERQRKTIKKDGDDLTYTVDKEVQNKLTGYVVPLEEFYPQSAGFRRIKGMTYCFWRNEVPFQKFKEDWSNYVNAQFVQPKASPNTTGAAANPFYKDYISSNVSEGNVEIIRYYNKDTDEYVISANGVWLNPVKVKGNTLEISPLPFNHKELPFWDIRFDLFGSDFFYGKSLPDRLKSLQDVLNVLTNMLLDQSFLTIFPPLLTNGFDDIEDDYLRPGRRTPIDTQGMPINQAFMKLDLGTPNGWHQYILEYTRKVMEQSSLDQVSSGQAGVGGRTTAQEIRLAAEGVTSMLSMFGRMVNYGLKRKAMLRAANILQFWTNPDTPMFESILGEGGTKEANKVFNTFKIKNAVLTDGKRGERIIEMYKNESERPSKEDLQIRSIVSKASTKRNIEVAAVDPQYLRDFEFDVIITANNKKNASRDIEKALQLEKVRVYMSFFPQQINVEELAAETAEKMGDDPTKILKEGTFGSSMPENQGGEGVQPMSMNPEMNVGNNAVRGMMGGEQNSMQLRDLQNSMLG